MTSINTMPGIHRSASESLFLLNDEEKKIVRKLSQHNWYITRVSKISLGGGNYGYALIKPVDSIARLFNIYREMLVVFSSYEKFEPRAFDVIDKLNVQELRLEEICYIIISRDPDIGNAINKILKSNQESRVLVPFTYEELSSENIDDIFVNRMRHEFFSRDLFGIQDPLKCDLYFFGRRELVHELVGKHENNENCGIFGLRKTGKTSILFSVERTLNKKKSIPILLDCQTLHNKPWNKALQYIIQTIIDKGGFSQQLIVLENERFEEYNAADSFFSDIKTLLNNHKKHILLIFDEIENITFGTSATESWNIGTDFLKFWQAVRSTYQRNDTKYHFSYLIAGTNPRCVEVPTIKGVDNPIFQQFVPCYIPPFDFRQTREMISLLGGYMGMKFSDEVCTHIVEDFGGHPLLMRQICSYIHKKIDTEKRPININKAEYETYKQEFHKEQTGFVQYAKMILTVLSDWYKDEYQMLKWLAIGDKRNFLECSQEQSFIVHLVNYGIIESDKTPNGYHFKIEAFQNYLANAEKYQKPLSSDAEIEAEVQERRSNIEKKIRHLVKRQLKSSLGEDEAKKVMIRQLYGAKEIGHKLNTPYKDLFDSSKHKIYLKTMFDLIKLNYNFFENLFGVGIEEFKSKSTLLNEYRKIDAHSTSVLACDFDTFRGIATWFETILSEE